MGQHGCDAVACLPPREREVLRTRRHAAREHDKALRADRRRLVDRPPVIVDRRLPARPAGGRKHAGTAQSSHGQAVIADQAGGSADAQLLERLAPGRDAGDTVAGAALDRLPEIPLLAHRRPVQRQPAQLARELAHVPASASRPNVGQTPSDPGRGALAALLFARRGTKCTRASPSSRG